MFVKHLGKEKNNEKTALTESLSDWASVAWRSQRVTTKFNLMNADRND
jgi:hypothetical protein